MSLDGFHRALAALVADPALVRAARAGDQRWAATFVLDERERRRLVAVAADDHVEVLCSLYRANRLTALVRTVPSVVEALGTRLGDHVTRYWASSPRSDLQFHAESADFCRFTRAAFPDDAALAVVLERAEVDLAARGTPSGPT